MQAESRQSGGARQRPPRDLGCRGGVGEACAKTGWQVNAHVLMANHCHLLLQTPEPNLVEGMKWLQGTYTQRLNYRHKLRSHLFQDRYKGIPFEGMSNHRLVHY